MKYNDKYSVLRAMLVCCLLLALGIAVNTCEARDWGGYVEVGVGHKFTPAFSSEGEKWKGRVPFVGEVGAYKKFGKHWYVKGAYMHISNWTDGPPFNDNEESVLDMFVIKGGVTF